MAVRTMFAASVRIAKFQVLLALLAKQRSQSPQKRLRNLVQVRVVFPKM